MRAIARALPLSLVGACCAPSRVAASLACVVAVSLLPGCADELDQPTCVPPELLPSCPQCGPAAVGAAVHGSPSTRFARLPGNRTAVLGCGKVQYLAPDYSVEREATVKMTYPAQIVAAGSGDETYLLDVERVHYGDPDSDEYLRARYTLIALEGDGTERWRNVIAPHYDDVVTIAAVPGGVVADFRIDSPHTVDRNGVVDVLPVRKGVLDETGGFIELPTRGILLTSAHLSASLDGGGIRWSKTLTPSSTQNPLLTILSVYGEPQGDTVITGALYGESLSIDDFVLAGGDPTKDQGFITRLDPSGMPRWAILEPEWRFATVLSGDRVIVGADSAVAVADQSGVTPILETGVRIDIVSPSTSSRIAAATSDGAGGMYLFDVALP